MASSALGRLASFTASFGRDSSVDGVLVALVPLSIGHFEIVPVSLNNLDRLGYPSAMTGKRYSEFITYELDGVTHSFRSTKKGYEWFEVDEVDGGCLVIYRVVPKPELHGDDQILSEKGTLREKKAGPLDPGTKITGR